MSQLPEDPTQALRRYTHDNVAAGITDAVTQANVMTIGLGPSLAGVQGYLSQAQAQGLLYANMVSNQNMQSMTSMATTGQSVCEIMQIPSGRAAPAPGGGGWMSMLNALGPSVLQAAGPMIESLAKGGKIR